jgi:sialate O-acetylesterase
MRNKLLYLLLFLSKIATANVSLPSFFSDGMVLQQNATVTIWGWASPNEEITLIAGWDNKEYNVKATNQAAWEIKLQTAHAGGPYTIKIKGHNEITLHNVMLGEVWFCSGQSNMEWTANSGIDDAEAEIAKADYENIRFFTVPKMASEHPQMNVQGNWEVCTPESMRYFSAVGYFFAQHLQENLKGVPIGIINASWGGTPAEIWMPQEVIASDSLLAGAAAKLAPAEWGPTEPARAWNAMVHPFAGLKIAGVLWYQGESNTGSGIYDKTLAALINGWRQAWHDDFPFYYVQIAPFNYEGGTTQGVEVRDAQRKVLKTVPKTGMVVISDISPVNDIHPRNKKTVGERLANLALQNVYKTGTTLVNGPLYREMAIAGDKVTLFFDNAEGLCFKHNPSGEFEMAGPDGVFHPANAGIVKDAIVLRSKKVKTPVRVRYAWRNTATADLFNKAGLPASSFITE